VTTLVRPPRLFYVAEAGEQVGGAARCGKRLAHAPNAWRLACKGSSRQIRSSSPRVGGVLSVISSSFGPRGEGAQGHSRAGATTGRRWD